MGAGGRARARKFAVRFDPPAFILDYEEEGGPAGGGGAGRRRLRVVKLGAILDLGQGQGVRYIARKVVQAFPRRLDRAELRLAQVERLVQRLVDALSGGGGASPRRHHRGGGGPKQAVNGGPRRRKGPHGGTLPGEPRGARGRGLRVRHPAGLR